MIGHCDLDMPGPIVCVSFAFSEGHGHAGAEISAVGQLNVNSMVTLW